MERIDKLNRNQVLKELQSHKKYYGKTQKEISIKFDGIVNLRNELKRLEKKKLPKSPKKLKLDNEVKTNKKQVSDNENDKKSTIESSCLVLLIWERKDRDDEVSTILLARDMDTLKNKFNNYFIAHREEDDYLSDDDFKEYIKDAVNLLDKMNKKNNRKAPEFNSAYIIQLKESAI
jgi:hypothetical protein